jgi:flagellar biosynthesis protein FliQ
MIDKTQQTQDVLVFVWMIIFAGTALLLANGLYYFIIEFLLGTTFPYIPRIINPIGAIILFMYWYYQYLQKGLAN